MRAGRTAGAVFGVIAVALAAPTLAGDNGVFADRIVFGQAAVLEGPTASLGLGMREGLLAAFSEVNRAGGIKGRKLELVSLRIDGAEPEFVRQLQAAGYERPDLDDLVSLRIHGVRPEFITELKALGYTTPPLDDPGAGEDPGDREPGLQPCAGRGHPRLLRADRSFDLPDAGGPQDLGSPGPEAGQAVARISGKRKAVEIPNVRLESAMEVGPVYFL